MELRYTSKSVIALLLGAVMAQGLSAQQSLTIGSRAHDVLVMSLAEPAPANTEFRGGAPVNDDCVGAVVEALAVGDSVERTGDNTGATNSYGFGDDVWEAFTITECADVTVEYCGTTPAFTGVPLSSLFLDCPLTNLVWIGNSNVSICGDGNFRFTYPQLHPGTYYFPVYMGATSTGPYQITFIAAACSGAVPVNDDCSGAIALTVSPACSPIDGDVLNASISGGSLPGIGCSNGDSSEDVWFSFVASATDHSILVDPSDQLSVVIEVHEGDCSGSNLVECLEGDNFGTPEQLDATGLTIGSTYYIRIYDWYAGVPVSTTFDICVVGPTDCLADAGTLATLNPEICFTGTNRVVAQPNGDAVVPPEYNTIYLLTVAPGSVIMQMAGVPEFDVTAVGSYTVHTLVYDPATLDTASIVLGSTTAQDVAAVLLQGGGTVCGSLDLIGVTIDAIICLPCDADAGTITADEAEVCLVAGSAMISATPDGNSVVPFGYGMVYVLTQGPGLVIVDAAITPDFEVTVAGGYAIHTFVYEANTFDLGSIDFDVTTASDVDTMLVQGGGVICASLDMTGAAIAVNDCIICEANAGTLTADTNAVCLLAGSADISATADGNSVVPPGYETIYVLTQGFGLVIVGVDANPSFTVTAQGTYTIHTLVYDTLTLDLGIVEIGVTTGFNVNALLIQGGGTICGSLDVTGAAIVVNDCAPANDDCANAAGLPINAVGACPGTAAGGDNTYATHDGNDPTCDVSTVGYADVWYTFNSGNNTTVTLDLDPGTMVDWAVEVLLGCGGNDLYCEVQPQGPIVLTTTLNTIYVVRVYSNLQFGGGGAFTICLSGAEPTVVCDGGNVQTVSGGTSETVCQDAQADVINFATTSGSGENYVYVLTDASNIIVTTLVGGSLDFNSAPLGSYRVWGISYNGDLVGADPGSDATLVTSTGTCIDLSNNFVSVTVEICNGITDATGASWNIFPNPGHGDFTLSYSGADALTVIEVTDMRGRILHQERGAMVRGQQVTVSLGGQLAPGIYSVRLTNAAGSAALRMTVR